MSELALILTAVALIITAVGTLITAVGTYQNGKQIKDVKSEVKTGNSQTLAQLADAIESRRIDDIPRKDRTPLEKSHIHEVDKVE